MKLYRHTVQHDMDPEDLVKLFAVMQFTATIVEAQLKELPPRLRDLFEEYTEMQQLEDQLVEAMENDELEVKH